jgi:NAD kinase
MQPSTDNRIVLVTRRTRLDELVARFNALAQARFYIEHLGADFSDYQREHELYYRVVHDAEQVLAELGRLHTIERSLLPNYLFGPSDTVVVIGQDGLVANTVKYAVGLPIIGVNPDPARWDGVLLPFKPEDLGTIVKEHFAGARRIDGVTMAQAELNTGQSLLAVNDFFIGVRSHTSARYHIRSGDITEFHSSSGVIVSTGIGSTGWFRSIVTGALEITKAILGAQIPAAVAGFARDAPFLYFTVREPFPSHASSTSLVCGTITREQPLELVSAMPESGVIFSDGVERDFLEFNSGTRLTIMPASRSGSLVV